MLTCPSWVEFGNADRRTLQFLWDDARADDDFTADASELLDAAERMSIRARLALLVGLYEWIAWRFEGLHQRVEVTQILDAAWCGTVDPRYLRFFELSREQWVGPVDGPLWCAFTYLEHGFRQSHVMEADTLDALEFLYLLATHVLPDTRPFEAWIQQTAKRFVEMYPVQPEDPFTDLFEERVGEHLGEFVGRDALDPALAVDITRDRAFLMRLLAQARGSGNSFVADEGDLADRRFEGVPYVLPELRQR